MPLVFGVPKQEQKVAKVHGLPYFLEFLVISGIAEEQKETSPVETASVLFPWFPWSLVV